MASVLITTVVYDQGMYSRKARKLERAIRLLPKYTGEQGETGYQLPRRSQKVASMTASRQTEYKTSGD